MTPYQPDYRQEFPDRMPIDVAIPDGFVDDSWRNDICPKFVNIDAGLLLWIEEPDPAERETSDWPRFLLERVERLPDGYEFLDDVLVRSEHFDDVLKEIEAEKAK